MKSVYKFIYILIIYICFIYHNANANWQKPDNNLNTQQSEVSLETPNTQQDSLPKGVTKDWLDDLRDENGNRINSNNSSRKPGQIPGDPEEDALQRKVFNGLSAGSNFGYSVSSAGDVNGDGFDDVIIGAYGYNSFTGRAYIYYGGLNMNTVADVTLTGISASNFFGYSVSAAGDVNGDGFSDVIVGAYGYTSNTGRAYVYFGGAAMNNIADVTITGEGISNFFGSSVASAGDLNGDGYSDVIIGATGFSSSTGKGYIYYGGALMNNTADVTMTGEAPNDTFGNSVSSAGDVNADGYSDVIIGAKGYSSSTGRGYIFLGGNSMDNTSDLIMTGESSNNNFGASVSSAGDINGDGFFDVIIGAYGKNSFTGKAYIYFGGAIMNATEDVTMSGEAVVNFFGASVSSAGDLNGDGYSDIIVGAYGNNSNTGKIYVYFGESSMDTTADVTMTGEAINNYFGNSVALAGDLNGDGYSDLLVGAYGSGSNTGRAYFYDYFMKNEITPELIFTGIGSNNYFGTSVSSAGDVNGDGYSDVIISSTSDTGKAYIYFGGFTMDNIADVVLKGETSNSNFGNSVSSAGDVNGDGYSDVIVGAHNYNSSTGRSYIFFGGSPMNSIADVMMTGQTINDRFGYSVSSAGDVNGDGYSDVIAGAYGYSGGTGAAYIFFGGGSMDNISDIVLSGEPTSLFGNSVSSAGDVNGDGFYDVIVGAYGGSSGGKVFIFFGGTQMNSTADISMTGEGVSASLGSSVSSAGDVNGDGYSDVIIGSHGYNSYTGRAYILFGGLTMDNIADVIMTGESISIFFGSSVSSGEINGDGYSDVIIGAGIYNSASGKTYIFFGGSSMNSSVDIVMSGESLNNYFGSAASSAGDINGDGYSDFIVGANGYNSGTGRAYIYKGSAISVKPILLHAKDVPNDQGGFVDLKWARSSNDVNGTDIITEYSVERSSPPSGGNFAWVNIANIPAGKNSFYSHLASTPYDSTSNSSGTFFFRITAKTNSPSQYWRSGILSGRSLDNISPPMVSPFNAFSETVNVRLTWKRSIAPDLYNYVLFRSTSSSIDPYTETPLTSLSDSTYLDTAPLSGLYYYFIVAQDIHNNYSPVAVTQGPVTAKNLFLFGAIQGLYDPAADVMIYDTVTVYLRNAVSPFAKIDSSKKLMYGPGTGQYFSFNNAQNVTPYYVEVKHRNALETWSADPVTFVSDAASIAFSVDDSYAYGNNQIQVDNTPYNVFAFYSGDVNQDGAIDLTDVIQIYNNANSFVTGYVVTDLTGDSIVDLTDMLMAYNNASAFVGVVKP